MALGLAPSPRAGAGAASLATISVADQPPRLLRDTSFHVAARGTELQAGDIVEAGAGTLQLEAGNCCTVALGPTSRIYLKPGGKAFEPVLLGGWMKLQARAGATPVQVSAGGLQLGNGGSVIVHASAAKTELFVETGDSAVAETQGGKVLRTTRVAHEHYAARSAGEALKVLPRPPREFLRAMPPAFQDALPPVAVKASAAPPKLERRASFDEVAPWLAAEPALHQVFHRRFFPPKLPKLPPHSY